LLAGIAARTGNLLGLPDIPAISAESPAAGPASPVVP
jgi:hypothetical protein